MLPQPMKANPSKREASHHTPTIKHYNGNSSMGMVEGQPCIYGTCYLTMVSGRESLIEHDYSKVGADMTMTVTVSKWKAYKAEDVA